MEQLRELARTYFPIVTDSAGKMVLPVGKDLSGQKFRQLYEYLPDSLAKIIYPSMYERHFDARPFQRFSEDTLWIPIVISVAYVVLCFGGRRLMKNATPFDLKGPLALWNLGLSLFSFVGAFRVVPHLFSILYHHGFHNAMCSDPVVPWGVGPSGLWTCLFVISKVPELFDTMFIVLRKKPLIFLHWYHHITVLLYCWHGYATKSAPAPFFVSMNYSVHAVMYFYYFLAAVGYRAKWGILVTLFQLSQMVVGVGICVSTVYFWQTGKACLVEKENLKWGIIMYSSYFALFLKFFLERYFFKSNSSKRSSKLATSSYAATTKATRKSSKKAD